MTVASTEQSIDYSLCHEIHTSARKSFKACRRRYAWHFLEEWTPIGMAPPLEFGIAFHGGMETLYNPETWDRPRHIVGELAVKKFADECRKQKLQYMRDLGLDSLDAEKEKEYEDRLELGKGMLRYYYQEQLPRNPEGFRPVRVEIAFSVPVAHPDTGEQLYCKCDSCWKRAFVRIKADKAYQDLASEVGEFEEELRSRWAGLPVVYAGRIDCLVEDADGNYWVVDWKTCRAISKDDEFLYLDDQIGSYVWALRKMLGLPVIGFVYHEQKKGFPKPPPENKVIRKGCRYSVSKQLDTDYETYLATIKDGDPEGYAAGAYDDYLAWLRIEGMVFYKRHVIIKTDHELAEIERNIGLEALDMLDPNLRIYPNSGRFSCTWCAFRQPCIGQNRGDDYEYTLASLFKKEEPYYYRQERGPSTESKGGE